MASHLLKVTNFLHPKMTANIAINRLNEDSVLHLWAPSLANFSKIDELASTSELLYVH